MEDNGLAIAEDFRDPRLSEHEGLFESIKFSRQRTMPNQRLELGSEEAGKC